MTQSKCIIVIIFTFKRKENIEFLLSLPCAGFFSFFFSRFKNLAIKKFLEKTANPNNYGGKELHLGLGMNLNLDFLPGGKDTIGIEILKPLDQDKNNLQMKTDYQIIIGYQKSL